MGELEGIVGEEGGLPPKPTRLFARRTGMCPSELHERKMGELQGGQKVRVLLAQALFGSPAALPVGRATNYLDLDSVALAADYLNSYEGVLIVISIDRHF